MRKSFFIVLALLLSLTSCVNHLKAVVLPSAPYGVLIGAEPGDTGLFTAYQTVIIDGAYFTKEEIDVLRQKGCRVYSYLNIGSVETFRDIYPKFQSITLDPYENWPDEFWVDVSRAEWQRHIVDTAARALAEKGVDGFFLDNADVYYLYQTQDMFDGLAAIISGLRQFGRDIIVNGGDMFVSRALSEGDNPHVSITGVNQECVFSSIDFENDTLSRQKPETTEYYLNYLEKCRKYGLTVYLTEYVSPKQRKLKNDILEFCQKNGYICYIASSIRLDGK